MLLFLLLAILLLVGAVVAYIYSDSIFVSILLLLVASLCLLKMTKKTLSPSPEQLALKMGREMNETIYQDALRQYGSCENALQALRYYDVSTASSTLEMVRDAADVLCNRSVNMSDRSDMARFIRELYKSHL